MDKTRDVAWQIQQMRKALGRPLTCKEILKCIDSVKRLQEVDRLIREQEEKKKMN